MIVMQLRQQYCNNYNNIAIATELQLQLHYNCNYTIIMTTDNCNCIAKFNTLSRLYSKIEHLKADCSAKLDYTTNGTPWEYYTKLDYTPKLKLKHIVVGFSDTLEKIM